MHDGVDEAEDDDADPEDLVVEDVLVDGEDLAKAVLPQESQQGPTHHQYQEGRVEVDHSA